MKTHEGWNVVDESAGVLWREYEFTRGARATTMVFRGVDGLVVLSPGKGLDARALDALREHGEVRALIANNTWHHLGQPEWRARFPDAVSYAPSVACATLEKKQKKNGIAFRPVSELAVPEHVRCEEMPAWKTGEVLVRVGTKRGAVWSGGDMLINMQGVPPVPIRWLFTGTDSAPGFRLFKLATWHAVKDKKALRAWALERVASDPPAAVVPAHGPAFEAEDVAALAKAQLERL